MSWATPNWVEMPTGCGCRSCLNKPELGFQNPAAQFIILCEHCGNKRCPHATDHRLECTRSNEPGQPGSVY
jgi:hypothetical protein